MVVRFQYYNGSVLPKENTPGFSIWQGGGDYQSVLWGGAPPLHASGPTTARILEPQFVGTTEVRFNDTGRNVYYKIVSITKPQVTGGEVMPPHDINPSQEFYIDSAKDAVDFAGSYLTLVGTTSSLASSGTAVTVAKSVAAGVVSRVPVIYGAVFASQLALNFAKYQLSSPGRQNQVKIVGTPQYQMIFSNTVDGFPPDSEVVPTSSPLVSPPSSAGGSDSPVLNNYDITSQYYSSYPTWNGGMSHPHLGEMQNMITNQLKNTIEEEFEKLGEVWTPQQQNDFKQEPVGFWEDFTGKLQEVIHNVVEKRGNGSYQNKTNEIKKKLQELIDKECCFKPEDINSIFSNYFSITKNDTKINIAGVIDSKEFSSETAVLEGAEVIN